MRENIYFDKLIDYKKQHDSWLMNSIAIR